MSDEATLDEFVEESEKTEVSNPTIPDGWRVTRADEIMEITRGASPRPKGDPELFGGDIPWVKIGDVDVKNARYTGEAEDTVTEKGAKKSKLVDEGTLLVSNSGTCGYPMFAGRQSCVHDGWLILRDYEDSLNPYYLYEYINWKQNYLKSLAPGSTQINLNTSRFGVLEINTPPLPEQRKIATVLYTVDRAIEKTEEIISQLGRTKQGLYQTLFSEGYKQHSQYQSIKYGKIPKSWNVSKLAEVTSQIQAGGTPDTDVTKYYGGNIPWVKTGELSQYHVTETEQSITERGLEESTARLFSPKTILIAMYGATTGEVSLLEIEAATNQACCGVVTTDEVVPEFLFHQLNHLSNRLESLSAGSGQQNISKGIIEKFDILVPPVEEQKSIVDVLNSVDESITKNKSTKTQYQRLKYGLMQDLLSGTVRTTDTNIEVPDEIAQYG